LQNNSKKGASFSTGTFKIKLNPSKFLTFAMKSLLAIGIENDNHHYNH